MQTHDLAGGVRISDILPSGRIVGADEIRVTSCSATARACRPGDLFVALSGDSPDGHEQVAEAISGGASAVLAERMLPVDVPQCVVRDTRIALGRLCQALAGSPSEMMHVTGITGTDGKTSTQLLLAAILEEADRQVGVYGSLGFSDGREATVAHEPTPGPTELARWLAGARACGCSSAVLEASTSCLASRGLSGIALDAAVVTNLRRDHLDRHGSPWNGHRATLRLLRHLKPTGVAVVNADDPGTKAALCRVTAPLLTYSAKGAGEVNGTLLSRDLYEQTALIEAGQDAIAVRTQAIGDSHLYNCLAATSVALTMGIDLVTIARGLEALAPLPSRLERLSCGQPFGLFLDVSQTPGRLARALRTLREATSGRVICVFGEGPARTTSERPHRGRTVERLADRCVVTSDIAHDPEPLRASHDLLDGFERPAQAHLLPDRVRAICWALSQAEPGDAVLIAGPHHSTAQAPNEPGYWSDAHVARSWLLQEAGRNQKCPWVPA
jgi:UDP-N-acetylmuramoyl-L-alanyl-D-glutamate--2,6-diaminopimelate ligase